MAISGTGDAEAQGEAGVTVEIAVGGMLIALFVGFAWGWKQCEEKHELEATMRESGDRIMSMAKRDGVIDAQGRRTEPVEKPH